MTMTLAVAIDADDIDIYLAGDITLALQGSVSMPWRGFPRIQIGDEYMWVRSRMGHGHLQVERGYLPDHAPYHRTTAASHAQGAEVIYRPQRGTTGG